MTFVRQPATRWHEEVPGARWFKADLHVHTIDDHLGGQAEMPPGISGNPDDPTTLAEYACVFLKGVIKSGIHVLGLTPHSTRSGSTAVTSAVWHIVDTWNSKDDDDGVPFRKKIYAVLPGFEPNVNDGGSGVHLLFLFDPEIGRDAYLRLFDAIMDGLSPWEDGGLRLTPRDAKEVFQTIDQHCEESRQSNGEWNYMVLASHFQGEHGLLREVRKQVLKMFPCDRLAGYQLGDDKLPGDFDRKKKPGLFLLPFMEEHRQSFFHASDAYNVSSSDKPTASCVGYRYTWVKLASPRIEALRQAFIASDSRMRIAYERDTDGCLREIGNPPDVTINERPWLQAVTVRGGASFFGGQEGEHSRETRFEFSPDLTCLIGGSMTGKSTLLDGLRVRVDAALPQNETLRRQVEARGKNIFLAGSPNIEIDCPGRDTTASLHDQWPAVFFTQNELQRLAEDAGAVEEILARLVPPETKRIQERRGELEELDKELGRMAKRLAELDEQLDEAEQAHKRADLAKEELKAFSEAGVERLHQAGRARQLWEAARQKGNELLGKIRAAHPLAAAIEAPGFDDVTRAALKSAETDLSELSLARRRDRVLEMLQVVDGELEAWSMEMQKVHEAVAAHEAELLVEVEHKLAEQGLDASKLKEFQALSKQASLLVSYEANLKEVRDWQKSEEHLFCERQGARQRLVTEQREAFDRVMNEIEHKFDGRIRSRRIDCGVTDSFAKFIRKLSQKGITRWWNSMNEGEQTSPEKLLEHLEKKTLADVGMTPLVQETFCEIMTRQKRREVAVLRCPDLYVLELRMNDGDYRRLDKLSGGQRVSVLLSLLLETTDNRPLVIDQPEDELDNRFLFDTVLPVLKRLKGRRQVIMATHNANIVVNGDADMVIQLEATANQGHVARAGAIEEMRVRDAIVRTVDGGDEAFRLRRLKYGF